MRESKSVPSQELPGDMGDNLDAGNPSRRTQSSHRRTPFGYAAKDGDGGGGGVFSTGDLNSGGRLAPEQGMFRKPRRSRVNNSEFLNVGPGAWWMKDMGLAGYDVGVPLTQVGQNPGRKKPRRPEDGEAGGPQFPHFTPGAGTSVHKDATSGNVSGGGSGEGDSFATSFYAHTFVVGRLRDGLFQDDPSFKRVNPYEAIFQKRGIRLGWVSPGGESGRVALVKREALEEEHHDWMVSNLLGTRIEARKDRLAEAGFTAENIQRILRTLGAKSVPSQDDPYNTGQSKKPRKYPDLGADMGSNDTYDALAKIGWTDEAREAAALTRHKDAAHSTDGIKADAKYLYHATNEDRADEIAESGALKPHGPSYGTDQATWPDGGKEKRSYFHHEPKATEAFAPGLPLGRRRSPASRAASRPSSAPDFADVQGNSTVMAR